MASPVRPKKHLGQHFLKDLNIAKQITDSLRINQTSEPVLEIGPGTGVLTRILLEDPRIDLKVCEIDRESIAHLHQHFPSLRGKIIEGDFLHLPLNDHFGKNGFSVIGNFPYNISSQILFKVLESRTQVKQVVGMFQREVARRITSPPGSKDYGILSVLCQTYFNTEYLFTVNEGVFDPPPKVKSGVIRLIRKENFDPGCGESELRKTVKAAFNQRRKTLKNALGSLMQDRTRPISELPFKELRAERLSWEDFVKVTNFIYGNITPSQSGQ